MKLPIRAGSLARLASILVLPILGPTSGVAQEASPIAGGSPVSFPAPEGGSLEVTLSADNGAPNNGEILDGARKLQLHLQSKSQKGFSVKLKWIAVVAEGIPANRKLAESTVYLNKEEERETWITAPDDVFPLGEYRAEIKIGNDEPQSINFKIISPLAPAELVTRENAPHGFNIALAVLGGRFESVAPEQDHQHHDARGAGIGVQRHEVVGHARYRCRLTHGEDAG